MRLVITIAALLSLSAEALAQQRPPGPAPSGPPGQRAPAQRQAQPAPPPPPQIFPCRTETEICYVGVVQSDGKLAVLFTNHEQGDAIAARPITVQGASLTQNVGAVVMLTGDFNAGTLANAQLVEAAGPLLSFAIKSTMSGDDQPQQQQQPARGGGQQRRR